MTKSNGLGMLCFVDGYDLSGNIGQLDAIDNIRSSLDVTTIDKSGVARLHGRFDGRLAFTAFFDDEVLLEHVALKVIPTADVIGTVFFSSTLGDTAFSVNGKRTGYAGTRAADGALTFTTEVLASGGDEQGNYGLSLTAGKETDSGATNGTGVDFGTTAPAVVITSSSVASPSNILCAAAHGLTTGDSVIIVGHSGSTPDINNSYEVTVIDTTNFTIPVNVSVGGTGGTMQAISLRFGMVAYLHVFEFTGTNVTCTIEESFDDAATDAYAAVTSGAFAAANGIDKERIETGITQVVLRYLRLVTSGTFSNAVFAVMAKRYAAADRER